MEHVFRQSCRINLRKDSAIVVSEAGIRGVLLKKVFLKIS